jgi:hypothetical protein
MRNLRGLVGLALVLLLASVGFAQEPPETPQPTPEHKELAMWVGDWKGSGEMEPGPFGPGGSMEWTENCSWFSENHLHIVCASKGDGPMGPMKGLAIIGYDAVKKVYTHYGVDSSGWSDLSEGVHVGSEWIFKSEMMVEGNKYHSRFTMNVQSPSKMTFAWEVSADEQDWVTLMDGTSTKQ